MRLDARRFDQSDGLDITQSNLGGDYRFADGRGRIGPRLDVEAAYDYSSSSVTTSTGFTRGIARISLIARF